MTKQKVTWTVDAEVVAWIQSLPGTPSEAFEKIIRREMEAERATMKRLRVYRAA